MYACNNGSTPMIGIREKYLPSYIGDPDVIHAPHQAPFTIPSQPVTTSLSSSTGVWNITLT